MVIVPALIYVFKYKYSPVKLFRLYPVNRNVVAVSIAIGFAFTVVSDEIDRIIQTFFPIPEIIQQALEEALKIDSTSDFIIIVFSAVFLAAFLEEMLFRGFIQTSFENTFDVTKAVMSTTLLFAVVHFNPWWSIQIMIFGIILGVMAWKSGSIIPAIIVHFINNSVALIFANLKPEQYQWYLYKNHVSIPIVLGAVLVTVYGFKLFYHYCDQSN